MNIDKIIKDAITCDDNSREVPYGTYDRSWRQIQERKSTKNIWFKGVNFSMFKLPLKEIIAITAFILILILVPSLASHYRNVSVNPQPASPSKNGTTNNETVNPAPNPENPASYSGSWIGEECKGKTGIYLFTGLDLKISEDGSINGTFAYYRMSDSASNRMADVFLKGTITSKEQTFKFDNDNWGHEGNITLKFEDDKIYVTVEVTKDPEGGTLWGVQNGTFALVRE